jgi:salicylate hydroxylase
MISSISGYCDTRTARHWHNGRLGGMACLGCKWKFAILLQGQVGLKSDKSVIHRADYHRVLLQEAEQLGTRVLLSTKVVDLDAHNGIISSEDHREVTADVIVGGDGTYRTPSLRPLDVPLMYLSGLWSVTRSLVLDQSSEPSETGDLAYRATFSLEELQALNDPRMTELCQFRGVSVWIGPGKHCVFYPLHNGTQFNLVLLRPDNMPTGERTLSGDIGELRDTFEGWDDL